MITHTPSNDPEHRPGDTLADSLAAALLPRTEPPVASESHPQAGQPTGLVALLDALVVLAAIRLRDRLQRWSADIERRQREQHERRDR